MENKAAWLESEKGKFVVRETELAQPGEGEVLIKVLPHKTFSLSRTPPSRVVLISLIQIANKVSKVRAVAIQPADAKVAKHAVVKMEYPTILGFLVSGTVEALGSGVSKVAVGDRVASPTKVLVHKKPKYGGLQRFTIVDEFAVVEVSSLSFHLP
jgi:NADPH:quinone reductase-like Zn-dependent oxidoreductase